MSVKLISASKQKDNQKISSQSNSTPLLLLPPPSLPSASMFMFSPQLLTHPSEYFSPFLHPSHLVKQKERINKRPAFLSSLASSSSFNPNSSIDGYATIQGARSQNEDSMQTFISPDLNDPRIYCVHDGHGGVDAVERLCAFMDRHENWISCTASRDKMDFIGKLYMQAIKQLEGEKSGVVSITAICDKEAVYFGWVGDCEGAIFTTNNSSNLETSPICQTKNSLFIDFAEQALICKTRDKNIMPSFFAVVYNDDNGNQTTYDITTNGKDACTSPHSLMNSSPILALESHQTPDSKKSGSNGDDASVVNQQHVITHVQLTAKPHSLGNQTAQREYELAQIESNKPLLELDVCFLPLKKSSLLVDARFKNSIQPTRALGDCDITSSFGTLRYPSVMKIPLASLLSGGKRLDKTLAQDKFVALCSDGPFSNGAFADMGTLTLFLVNPLLFFRKHFYHAKQELALRLVECDQLSLPHHGSHHYHHNSSINQKQEEAEGQQQKRNKSLQLMQEWKKAGETWKDAIAFIATHHWNAVCGREFQETFSILTCSNSSSSTTATTTQGSGKLQAKPTATIAHYEHHYSPYSMNLLTRNLPPYFSPSSLSNTTTKTNAFISPIPSLASTASAENFAKDSASATTILTDDAGYLIWRKALEVSIRWLIENVGTEEPSVQAAPSLKIATMAAAHMAVVMGGYDNVTVLVAKLCLHHDEHVF